MSAAVSEAPAPEFVAPDAADAPVATTSPSELEATEAPAPEAPSVADALIENAVAVESEDVAEPAAASDDVASTPATADAPVVPDDVASTPGIAVAPAASDDVASTAHDADAPATETPADAPLEASAPVGPTRRPFRPPWWAGNRTAAASPAVAPPRLAPAVRGPSPVPMDGVAASGSLSEDLPAAATPRAGLDRWFAAHGSALLWLLPVMAFAALVTAFAVDAPARTAEEGVLTGYVWNLLSYGDVASFTAWAQHPPLGWMQMAAYVQSTGAFGRWGLAVLAVREAMIFFAALTAGAAWLLARRVGLSRLVATIAAAALSASPFALAQHAAVSLENVAVPWLLVAFVLATARRSQSIAFAGSAAAFAVAIMSAETAVLALPFLVWTMLGATRRGARMWPLVVAALTLQVIAGLYLLVFARGVFAPPPLSPVFAAFTGGPAGIGVWWQADPVLLVLLVVGSVFAIVLLRRLRPLAAFALAGIALLAIPGLALSAGFAALVLPAGVVVLAGGAQAAVALVRARGLQRTAVPVAFVAVVALGVVAAVPVALMRLPGALAGQAADPMTRAERWLLDYTDPTSPVLVDTSSRVDFLRAGWPREEVADYGVDGGALPTTWADAAWAIVPTAQADAVSADSVVVATFDGLDVRRVVPGLVPSAEAAETARADLRSSLGGQVADNPQVLLSDSDRALMRSGGVDDRIVSVLGALSAFGRVDVAGFPEIAGETGPLRQVALTAEDGDPLVDGGALTDAGHSVVDGLLDRYTPEAVSVQGDRVVLRYSVELGEPAD